MMLRHLGLHEKGEHIEKGLTSALSAGIRTADLSQKSGCTPVSTMGFAEGIIKHFPPQATQELFDFKFDFAPKHATTPATNEMMASPPPKEQKTVGADLFLDSTLLPSQLAEKILPLLSKEMDLVLISNRGTQVWPTGSVFTQLVNHHRIRLQGKDRTKALDETELLLLASKISKTARVCSIEMLRVIDGLEKFTKAQGQ
jgi:isocitrate dehydrogenase